MDVVPVNRRCRSGPRVAGLVRSRHGGLYESYRPGARSWRKFRVRDTLEMIVSAVTGAPRRPQSLLLGRHAPDGRLRYTGRTSALPAVHAQIMGGCLRPVQEDHPWAGWIFSAGWGSRDNLQVSLVVPETVVEISADVSRDARGRLRHHVRFVRVRAETCHRSNCEGRPHEGRRKGSHAELRDIAALSTRRRTALAGLSADQAGP